MSLYCDRDDSLWSAGLGAWTNLFYISKFYEFVDTWILVWKGKSVSFLQTYHHTGIVFAMWGAILSHSAWILFLVLLNSIIHTLMYAYFFVKTISPQTQIKAAKYLTRMQIGQLVTGLTSTMGVLYMGDTCDTQSSRFTLAFSNTYVAGLIILFMVFAKRKYKRA